jgi:hypothetical protein
MSTLTPSRLNDVSNAALFRELTADNFTILAGEIAKRVATYQNGNPTTVIGPPTSGTRVLNEFWRDALGGEVTAQVLLAGWGRKGRPSRARRRYSSTGKPCLRSVEM